MNLIDRVLIRNFLKAYIVCLVSLLSLYIVVDLFTNIDDFAEHEKDFGLVLKHIGTYYGYKIAQIFDRLCEVIVLLAAMFTVAMMQRNNELLPMLSAGISTHRAVRWVLFSACVLLLVSTVNQELVIPEIAGFLNNDRDDPNGDKPLVVHGCFEPNGIHIAGARALRRQKMVKEFACLIPETLARNLVHLTAEEAYYYPPGQGPSGGGGWLLTGTQPPELGDDWKYPSILENIDSGKYFLHTKYVDFDSVTRPRNWFVFSSTFHLFSDLNRSDVPRLPAQAVLFHTRLTRPILGLLLVFMGLSVILRDQNRNVFISTALCLVLCAAFYCVGFACKYLGDSELISPALAAWVPVLLFGPLAFVLFDAIHT